MSNDVRERIRMMVGEYEDTLDHLGDITVDEIVARANGGRATSLRGLGSTDRSSSRLGVVAAVCMLVGGMVAVLAWTGRDQPASLTAPPGSESGASTPTTLVAGAELFVWPGPDQNFATVDELVGAFVDTQLGWTAYDLVGEVDDQQQSQPFTLLNGDLDVGVAAIAVPSPNGWGFVQIGDGGMDISVGSVVDGGSPILEFDPMERAVSYSIQSLLAHGGYLTVESATSPVEIPVEPNIGVASVLVLGRDENGVVVGATGGQFHIGEEATPPTRTAAPTSAPTPDATQQVPLVDSGPVEAVQAEGRVLVLNATYTGGIAGDLTARLRASGYDVAEPDNAADGVQLAESIIYTRVDMPDPTLQVLIASALGIRRSETIGVQTAPALTPDMIESNDLIIVLGDDLADAPWRGDPDFLVDQGAVGS